MLSRQIYYTLKPFIPRRLQIFMRRKVVQSGRRSFTDIWPITEHAGQTPPGWPGWPQQKRFAFVLTHDVEKPRGHDRCLNLMALEQRLGFRSSFNFVPERYCVSPELRQELTHNGFEVGVHGLKHDGKLYRSEKIFQERAVRINQYLKEWGAVGFRSPAMHHNLEWLQQLNIEYDLSTFDVDPFEPQADGTGTIFPFWVAASVGQQGYWELPYTLTQDFTLFVLMQEKNIAIWKRKLDWVVERGGMALLNTHPDYMSFNGKAGLEEYPVERYIEFLEYIKCWYDGQYWQPLPREVARFCSEQVPRPSAAQSNQPMSGLKICVIAHTAYDSDARVRHEAECLAERGALVDILCLRQDVQPKYDQFGNLSVHRLLKYRKSSNAFAILCQLSWFFVFSFFWVSYKYWRRGYDFIHIHTIPDFEVFAALVPKLGGARVVLDMHEKMPDLYRRKFGVAKNHWIIRFMHLVEKYAVKFADHVFIASPFWRDDLIAQHAPPHKVTTILNLPKLEYFGELPRNGLPRNGRFKLVYPGTLSEHHGVDIVLRALHLLQESDAVPVQFHIYGNGPEKERLAAMAKELNLEDAVIFHQIVPCEQLAHVLATMDAGVVPKRSGIFVDEALSTKLFEFAAVGLPTVVSRTKSDSLFFDESMVLFFEPGNEQQLADGIRKLYREPAYRQALSQNIKSVFQRISWEIVQRDFCAVFDSLKKCS